MWPALSVRVFRVCQGASEPSCRRKAGRAGLALTAASPRVLVFHSPAGYLVASSYIAAATTARSEPVPPSIRQRKRRTSPHEQATR